jgi:alkylhydroperoxidase family enzyme
MTTLKTPQLSEFSAEDQTILKRISGRVGMPIEQLLKPGIFGVQAHWPAWLEANLDHSFATYLGRGALPPLAKEAMHVAVSMTNHCEY